MPPAAGRMLSRPTSYVTDSVTYTPRRRPMRPSSPSVILLTVLALAGACSDGTLPPSRSPDAPSNPNAPEAPLAQTSASAPGRGRASPAVPSASATAQPAHHHHPPAPGGAE